MKNHLLLIASAIILLFTACGEVDCDHETGNTDTKKSIVGSWYEEAENEEIRFAENGTFYDKYANFTRCEETEGRWQYDEANSKLTETYPYMGQMQYLDWTIKDWNEFGFTISSKNIADHHLEKIVEDYSLKVGQTQPIEFNTVTLGAPTITYRSNNERIASVSPDGIIKAEGEKGVTYIQVKTSKYNVWVKVTVGDNCPELWHDFVGIIGMDYSSMSKALSRIGTPIRDEEDYAFKYVHKLHATIDVAKVFICPEDNIVTEIHLYIKEAIPNAEIIRYMDARYYKMKDNGDIIFYSTSSEPEDSKAIIAYDKSKKTVFMFETQHFLHDPHFVLWEDFTGLFGKDKKSIEQTMAKSGNIFLMEDYNYSDNGSLYYNIAGNEYATMVGFVLNTDNVVSEYWVYMNRNSNAQTVYDYLVSKYTINEAEATDHTYVFYNSDKSLRVVFDLLNAAVIYTNMNMKQHSHSITHSIFGKFHEALGLNHDEVVSKLGTPIEEEKGFMYYIGNEYISIAAIKIDPTSNICKSVIMMLNDNVTSATILDYCNKEFTVYEKGTMEDGSQYAWINGPSFAESKYGILYVPSKKYVSYTLLNSSQNATAKFHKMNDASVVNIRQLKKRLSDKTKNIKYDIKCHIEQMVIDKIKSFK